MARVRCDKEARIWCSRAEGMQSDGRLRLPLALDSGMADLQVAAKVGKSRATAISAVQTKGR